MLVMQLRKQYLCGIAMVALNLGLRICELLLVGGRWERPIAFVAVGILASMAIMSVNIWLGTEGMDEMALSDELCKLSTILRVARPSDLSRLSSSDRLHLHGLVRQWDTVLSALRSAELANTSTNGTF